MSLRTLTLAEVLDQFGRALNAAGLVPSDLSTITADGVLHRFHVEGDKRQTKNGWYVLHADGVPAGEFGTWKDAGASHTWCANIGRDLDVAELAEIRARTEAARRAREAERAKEAAKARKKAADLLAAAKPAVRVTHPYLAAKKVRAYGGIRQLGEQLLIPLRDTAGVLHGVQFIQPDGSKKFGTGTAKAGCYFGIGIPRERLLICEGYATGATLHEATAHAVAVAFDAGNLMPVARALREKFADLQLVIAADNDHATEGNPGLTKAREAAAAAGARVAAPMFAPGAAGTDWNDYAALHGLEAVREAFAAALLTASESDAAEVAGSQHEAATADTRPSMRAVEEPAATGARFDLRADGLFWCGVEFDHGKPRARAPVFICSPIKIEAVTRDLRGRNFGRLVSFRDSDGVPKTCNLSARALGSSRGDELRGALLSDGLPMIAGGAATNAHLTRYLMAEVPSARARMVTRTGWHGPAFVLPQQTFGNTGGERYYLADEVSESSSYERAGTFERWRDTVSVPGGAHKRVLFALACAFAGPLIDLAGAESGGFHLVGGSSSGKTTALRLAGSVWGSADSYWRQWRATDNGLEAVAEEFGDTLLALDEIGQADPKIVGEVAYMLANGRGKQRARKDAGARAIKSWRVMLLSTGEVGSAALMNAAGHKARAGHDVRLVELPADAGRGYGLFDSDGGYGAQLALPVVDGTRISARSLALALGDAARTDYGHAGPLFVERLAHDRIEISREARERIAEFVQDVCPKGADGQVQRVAARFGLVCYAGERATQWDLTGWDFEAVRSACVDAFMAWLGRRGTAGAKEPAAMIAQVRGFIEAHSGARFQDIGSTRSVSADYSRKGEPDYHSAIDDAAGDDIERRIINRAGYRKREAGGRTLYLVFPETFHKEVCEGFEPRAVCAALAAAGVLAKPEGDRYTSKHSTPQASKRLPFYALDGDVLLSFEGA